MSWTLSQAARATPVLAKDQDQRPEDKRIFGSLFWVLSNPLHHVTHTMPPQRHTTPVLPRTRGSMAPGEPCHLDSLVPAWVAEGPSLHPFWGGPPVLLRWEPSASLLHRDSGELGHPAVCQARSPVPPPELTPDSVLNAALLPCRPYGEFVTRTLCSSGNR